MSSCATNPIWLIKTRLQLDRSQSSLSSVIRRIHAEGGIRGFWKGLTASWWGISETMIHFVIYEYLKKCLARRHERDRGLRKSEERTAIDFIGFMMCGATSKTCATCVAYPHGEQTTLYLLSNLIFFLLLFPCAGFLVFTSCFNRGQNLIMSGDKLFESVYSVKAAADKVEIKLISCAFY